MSNTLLEEQKAGQEGWFWSGRGANIHLPGPMDGWSLCGSARLRLPANHLWARPWKHYRFGHKCRNCLRLNNGAS